MDQEKSGAKSRAGIVACVIAAALPILYVLSDGPVIYFEERCQRQVIPNGFYRPVRWMMEGSPLFRRVIGAYDRWWYKLGNPHDARWIRPESRW